MLKICLISRRENLAVASDRIIAAFFSRLLESKTATFLKVLLVVLLSPVELLGRQNLSDDFPIQDFLLFFQRLLGRLLLLRSVKVYPGSVLCSHIITLPWRINDPIKMKYWRLNTIYILYLSYYGFSLNIIMWKLHHSFHRQDLSVKIFVLGRVCGIKPSNYIQ